MKNFVTIILLLFCGFCCKVHAGDFLLQGHVFDEKGKPLQYVNVMVVGTTQGAVSESDGAFSCNVSGLNQDTIYVSFSFVGYEEITKKILTSKTSGNLSVYMKEMSEVLDQYEINVYRKQESTIERLDVEKLKSMPDASGGGIEALISTQAGVSMNNELSSQYSVRGGNYDENSVYVNSIEVYRPLLIRSGEQEGLSFVNPNMVESVSFSSGGFGVDYGDKMSSVLDIRYKRPSHFEGSASISLLGASAYVGHSNEKFSQMHGIRYKTSSYMLGALQTDAEYNPNFLDYQTYLTYDFSDKFGMFFLGNVSRNDFRFMPISRETKFGTTNETFKFNVTFHGQEKDLFLTAFGALAFQYKVDEKSKLELLTSAFHTSESVSYDIKGSYFLSQGSDLNFNNDLESAGVSSYYEHARNKLGASVVNVSLLGTHKLPFNELKWGATYQREIIDDEIGEWELRDSAGYSMPGNINGMSLYDNLKSKQDLSSNRLSLYIQDTYTRQTAKGKVNLSGGVRLSYWDFNKEVLLSPRVAVSWFPSKFPNLGLRAATGIYYQSLFYKEIKKEVTDEYGNSSIELNDNIKSPRSYQVILASDYYFNIGKRPFKFTAEAYGKYIDRIIPYVVDNTQITYDGENKADGFAAGADLKLFGEFVPGTDSWVSLSMMRTMENIYGDDQGYIRRPTDQLYNVSLFFQDYFPGYEKLKFNIKFIWADGLPYGPKGSESLKSVFSLNDYRRLDLGVAFWLRKGVDKVMERKFFHWMKVLSLNFDVFNLLGTRNESSVFWIQTSDGVQYAVPNYLTGRRFNFKIQVDF